ncbi:hypothetical protein RHGRI_004398 [Rhododendron griersonianum]|uniref:Uncharacterized protein n=1 Tax=Rhododendron griersonianum TaxID=479676 RepID=A0AAV6L8U4_9ERIC|nr:hypothetical protein RHGRI_004398 [Rhododendron griersonianum]
MAFTLPFLSVGIPPVLSPQRPAQVFCRSRTSSNGKICTDIFDKASPSVVFLSHRSDYQGLVISEGYTPPELELVTKVIYRPVVMLSSNSISRTNLESLILNGTRLE